MPAIDESMWPPEWHNMTAEQRGNDLLMRMLKHPPMKNSEFIGKSIRIPRKAKPKRDNRKPEGFYNVIPDDTLLARIHKIIPRGLRPEWRDDLIQDLATAIISGEMDEGALEDMNEIRKVRNKVIARYPDKWEYLTVSSEESADDELRRLLEETSDLAEVQKLWKAKGGI